MKLSHGLKNLTPSGESLITNLAVEGSAFGLSNKNT